MYIVAQCSAVCMAAPPISVVTITAGYEPGYIPKMDDGDTIEIFELKAPVWEFKFGKLLGEFVSL